MVKNRRLVVRYHCSSNIFLSDKPCGATGMKENKIKLVICTYRVIVENQQHISMIVFQISFITMK
jgi:hypothetical protein